MFRGVVWIVYSIEIAMKGMFSTVIIAKCTLFDTFDFKRRPPIQSESTKRSHTHLIIHSCLHRFADMRGYLYSLQSLLSTSTVKVFGEFKTFILGALPMLLTVAHINSSKTFINLSKCLCYKCIMHVHVLFQCICICINSTFNRCMRYQVHTVLEEENSANLPVQCVK